MNKDELKKLLNYHDNLYYNQDDPEITDAEYDALKNQYVALYGEYDYVPGKALFNKVKHTTNISSLDKVQITDQDKIRSEIIRLWPVVIQPKLDGLTLVSYPNGKHVTRGSGEIGEDVTESVNSGVSGVGKINDKPIRSEAIMPISEFKRINEERENMGLKPFKNPRNAAAGMLRNKDIEKIEGLTLYAYNVISEYSESNLNVEQLNDLKTLGWNVVTNFVPETVDEAVSYILNFDRSKLDYEIDGLVIKHNGNKKFGFTGHHPKSAIAVKFEAQGAWTTINRIVWQVGRTGKITPVAEFEPVDILGSTVSRATLHNMGIINALKLGCLLYENGVSQTRVKVIKANDVIPAIIEVENYQGSMTNIDIINIDEPECCPMCKGHIEKFNDQIFCANPTCSSKILGKLVHLAQKDAFNIAGLSEETAKKLIAKYKEVLDSVLHQMDMTEEAGAIDEDYAEDFAQEYEEVKRRRENMHPSFIYDLTFEDILSLDGFAKKSAQKLYNEIQNSKHLSFDKFLYGCGIPLIGKKASKDIAMHYSSGKDEPAIAMGKDWGNDFASLYKVEGIGKIMINSLIENFENMVVPFGEYNMTYERVEKPKKALNQKTIVITGEFETKRSIIKAEIESYGHKVAGSVSTKTDILLAAPGEETSSKYRKATELIESGKKDIQIINSLDALYEML